jgi:Rap/ran-GAP
MARPEYLQFLNYLGDTIELKGHKGYRGDLDISGISKPTLTLINSLFFSRNFVSLRVFLFGLSGYLQFSR